MPLPRSSSRLAPPIAALCAALWFSACAAPPAASPSASAPAPAALPASASASAAPPDPRVLGLWKIEQARAAPVVHKLNARIEFGKDGQLRANGGCNGIAGAYTLAGNRLKLGSLAITRKSCNEVLMEQEDRIITALERAVGAAVPPHGLLELSDENGTVLLRGTRVEPAN